MNGLYRKRLRPLAFLLPAGGLYALFVHATGLMIPCPFRLITGLKCPGCGMTHMCMSLLRLDFKAASKANVFLFATLPLLLLEGLYQLFRKEGKEPLWNSIFLTVYTAALLVFGIVRNLNGL